MGYFRFFTRYFIPTMRSDILAAALNNLFWDRVSEVSKRTIEIYSKTKVLNTIESQLKEWERSGYLQVIKPLAACKDNEPCIRLLSVIPLEY